jgi:hypothetical protein
LGIINFDVGAPTRPPYAGFGFAQFVLQAV